MKDERGTSYQANAKEMYWSTGLSGRYFSIGERATEVNRALCYWTPLPSHCPALPALP